MSFPSLAGARVPHEAVRTVVIAVFNLPGGTHAATVSGAGESVGWRVLGPATRTVDKFTSPPDAHVVQHSWLSSLSVSVTDAPPGYVLYDTAAALKYLIRATVTAGSAPSSGGVGTWLDLTAGRTWYVNSGGSPGEVSTSTLLLEIAEDITGGEVPGPVLASGTYVMTVTRS